MGKMPRSKDRSRSELEKLREMNCKEKISYIWSYYSSYIIGIGFAFIVIISWLASCLGNPEIGLSIEWNRPYIEQSEYDAVISELNERLFHDEDDIIVQGGLTLAVSDDLSYMMTQLEKTMAMVAAGSIDIFIVDEIILDEYSAIEFLMPLDSILADLKTKDYSMYERIEGELTYANLGIENPAEHIMGINITNSPLIRDLSINLFEDAYLGISVTATNYDNIIRAIIEIFNPAP